MKYEVRKYETIDMSRLIVDKDQREIVAFVGAEAFNSTRGPGHTALADGELIVIAGINILWPGVGEAWAFLGGSYRKHGRFIHRTVKNMLSEIAFDLKLERVQAAVEEGHWAGIRWVDVLGFKFEGEMPGYFRGKTYLRYAKIFY